MDLKRVVFGNSTLGNVWADLGLLVLRLFVGLTLAFSHGIGKLPPEAGFAEGVGKLGFPAPMAFAWAASLSEFLGGLLLAIGLLTRPAAFFIAFTMGTAAFLHHAADPFQKKELAIAYFAVSIAFMLIGSGRFGLDAWIGSGTSKK